MFYPVVCYIGSVCEDTATHQIMSQVAKTANEFLCSRPKLLLAVYEDVIDPAYTRGKGSGLRPETTPCLLSTRACGERGSTKYPVIKRKHLFAGKARRYYTHHVAMLRKRMRMGIDEMWDTNVFHVSHECHRPTCVNTEHLRLISKEENQAKSNMSCIGVVVCGECGTEMELCEHPTRCLTAKYVTCSTCQ